MSWNMNREWRTLEAMLSLYCHDNHLGTTGLCPECTTLLEYARTRLEKCPLRKNKPVCSRCPVHCYNPAMREKIRCVMKYSGPRIIRRHPVLALCHLLRALKKVPAPR